MSHTTIIATDFEPRIIVEDVGSGYWFKVLHEIIDDGTAADLRGESLLVLMTHLRHRKPDGRSYLSIDQLSTLTKRHRSTVFRAHDQLQAARPMLLRRHSDALWEPLPGRRFAGERPEEVSQSCDPPSRNPATLSRGPETSAPFLRAQNQPTKDKDREIGQTREQDQARGKGSLVGWPELSLFGQRAFAAGDALGVLRDLGVGESLIGQIELLAGLTPVEVMGRAAEVAADATVRNRPYVLAVRIALARGVKLERPEIGRARRMGDDWAQLARLRVMKRGGRQ